MRSLGFKWELSGESAVMFGVVNQDSGMKKGQGMNGTCGGGHGTRCG